MDWGGAMLVIDDLRIRQGAFWLNADASIPAGRRVVIMGPSGAGKSTLVAALAGFVTPDSGRMTWQGQALDGMPPATRPIAMLFQDGNLFPHLNVAQNIALGFGRGAKPSPQNQDQIGAALAQVGLTGFENRKPASLSGGEQSRVAVARVLVMERPILVLDEPFAALGPAMRIEMLALVRKILDQTGATLLMVSHDPADAHAIAEDLILVADGRAVLLPDAQAVLADPPPALATYLG